METIYFLLTLIQINFIKCDNSITYEGRYIQPPPAIEICISDKKQMKESIIHELWHFFYFQFLNEYDQKLWSILYNKSTIDGCVTGLPNSWSWTNNSVLSSYSFSTNSIPIIQQMKTANVIDAFAADSITKNCYAYVSSWSDTGITIQVVMSSGWRLSWNITIFG